jgi:hypothetical protein
MSTDQIRICPQCGYEYEQWVEVCPDCGVPIESRSPEAEPPRGVLDPDTDPEWTAVANLPNAIIGNFIKSQLEDAGIPVLMVSSHSAMTHNEFVPIILRVPRHMVEEARRLIDSPPGNSYGPSEVPRSAFHVSRSDDAQPEHGEPPANGSGLPEGWAMLPTEGDVRARQEVRRTHGEILRGWYWSDQADQSAYGEADDEYDARYDEYDYEYESAEQVRERVADPYAPREDEGWYRPSKWIRIFYGILLLAISLPFILQLLQQVWAMFDGLR